MATMWIRGLRFMPVLSLATLSIVLGFSGGPTTIPLSPALSLLEESDREIRPFDTPDEAQEFYRLKRAPIGQQAIPVERYLTADDQTKLMAQYSSATNSFAPNLGTWTQLGPGNIGGRTRALVVDRLTPSVMYAGGVAGGMWKTTDGGGSWAPKGDLLSNLAVCSMAMDPNNSSVLYAGTGEGFGNGDAVRGAGIYKSTNAGETWTQLNSTDRSKFYYVNDIVVSSTNSQRVYAGTRTGVWRSTNGGGNWTKVLSPGLTSGCLDLAIRTDQTNDYVFASFGRGGGANQGTIYRNTNAGGGGTWTVVYTESGMGRTSLAIAPSSQNVIYALAADGNSQAMLAVLRSTDGGATWTSRVRNTDPTKLNTVLLTNPVFAFYEECGFGTSVFYNQGWYDNVIAVDPATSSIVWAGGIDLFRSDDGGANWGIASHWWASTNATQYAHSDQHAIVFHPQYNGTTNKTMFVAGDGGIFRTNDARAATGFGMSAVCNQTSSVIWASLNNNYGVTQFYHGLPYPDGLTYFGGTQDNGTVRGSDNAGTNGWGTLLGGDGGYVAIDPANTNILYAENVRLSLKKSYDGGASGSWPPAINGITEPSNSFNFIAPFIMDPSNSQRLWIGGNRLWRTADAAANWSQASAPLPVGEAVSALTVAPTNANRVLAGTQLGQIYRTDIGLTSNASTTWSSITLRNYGDWISWVTIDPGNANIAYATVSSFNYLSSDHHVYKSTNGGVSWISIDGSGSTGIPDIPVHCIVVDPNDSSRLYVGTDLGVFVSLDDGASWNRENTGFANAVTEALAFDNTGGVPTLLAFTHGRGAWRVVTNMGGGGTATAAYVRTDTTTQGNWHGAYGSDGYNVINDSVSYPNYAQVVPSGQSSFTWAPSTTDARALQKAIVNDRIAATWYADTSFSIDVNLTDGGLHQLALYCLDWDLNGRAETIAILDAATNAVLDTRNVSGFSGGQYLVWDIRGHVKIRVTKTAGYNPVVSGLFFGGGGVPAQATFVQTDVTTKGNWHGAYGNDGYNIIDDSVSYPNYAQVSASGQSNFVWVSSTTDVRALQKAASTSERIAACWYADTSFTIDLNLTDGQTHRIALYCLDWDLNGRSETVDIIDASNAAVLNSQSASAFANGKYLVWNIRGHVQIRLTKTAGYNTVLSGIFFN